MPHAKANGLDIYYESHGDTDADPILLIMGLGAQMTRWSPDFIGKLQTLGQDFQPNRPTVILAMLATLAICTVAARRSGRVDDRKIVNAIFYVLRTGIPWQDSPERYGP